MEEIMALRRETLKYRADRFMLSVPAGERLQWETNLNKVLEDCGRLTQSCISP